jgi:hypothetical protein
MFLVDKNKWNLRKKIKIFILLFSLFSDLSEVLEYTRGPRTELLLHLMDQVRGRSTKEKILIWLADLFL